ncbi:hypothetical protein QE152_g7679 [Popillia japonica]|uniref:Uncharacterized protein n=1 Tax=Popillia japonica TaxID=7064 RepID=A0AAW1M8U9_POPJA
MSSASEGNFNLKLNDYVVKDDKKNKFIPTPTKYSEIVCQVKSSMEKKRGNAPLTTLEYRRLKSEYSSSVFDDSDADPEFTVERDELNLEGSSVEDNSTDDEQPGEQPVPVLIGGQTNIYAAQCFLKPNIKKHSRIKR